MPVRHYLGIAEPGPDNWSLSFPAFPGVTTVGDNFAELVAAPRGWQGGAGMQEDGIALPVEFTADPGAPGYDPADYRDPRVIVVGVEVGSRALRINVTMDEALLSRLDAFAQRTHASRSGLLAQGARLVLAGANAE